MKNLLYKEFRMAINPLFYILIVFFGALMFIPEWFFFLVPLYLCMVVVPNMFSMFKTNNDLSFSAMLPVRKSDIVKARVISLVTLEVAQILIIFLFSLANKALYKPGNFAFDPNAAFFGLIFVMYGLYNIVFLPIYYTSGYKMGLPSILAVVVAVAFGIGMEVLSMFSPVFNKYMEQMVGFQKFVLFAGILIFIGIAIVAYKISVRLFDKVDM